jgi:hypothetical protein
MENIYRRTLLIAFAAILSLGLVVPAHAVTLSLPELTGGLEMGSWVEPDFDYPDRRTCHFVIPDNVTSIDDLTFVLSGEWFAGEISCSSGFPPPTVSPFLPGITIFITSDAFPGDYFLSSIGMPDDSFEYLASGFSSSYPPGVLEYNDLLGAELHAELQIDWLILGICHMNLDSYGVLDQVELHITGTVDTEDSSLDRIKSLYR